MLQSITKFTPEQLKEFITALQDAFRSFDELKKMYRLTFNDNLTSVIEEKGTEAMCFDLAVWAETKGKINDLVAGAYKENPTNALLKAFIEKITVKIAPSKFFDNSVRIADVKPLHILGKTRAKTYKDFYYTRKVDKELYDHASRGENILLLGNSLAGKTRAVLELLRKLAIEKPQTCLLFPKNVPLDSLIDVPLQEGFHHIAFIEDIDDYYRNDKYHYRNYDNMLRLLAEKGVQILATCRTGPEYQEFKTLSDSKIRELFELVSVGKITDEEVKGLIEQKIVEIEKSEFDGNIGSLFMRLEKMRDRYNLLATNSQDATAQLAVRVLQALRAFYFASNFTRKSVYIADNVIDFCLRAVVGKYASTQKQAATDMEEKLKASWLKNNDKKIKDFQSKISKALTLLESDEDHLNFVEREGDWLKIEEVYLEKIVQYSPTDIKKDIYELYDTAGEREQKGFFVKIKNYNAILREQPKYPEALDFFKKMRNNGVKPNTETYCILIEKASKDRFDTVLQWYKEVKDQNLPLTSSLLMAVMQKCKDFESLRPYLSTYLDTLLIERKEGIDIEPKCEALTQMLLPQMLQEADMDEYVMLFFDKNIRFPFFAFGNMVMQSKAKIAPLRYASWLQFLRLTPNKVITDRLLQKTASLQEGLDLLQHERFKEVVIEASIVVHLLQKATSLQEGVALLEKEWFKGVVIDTSITNHLLQKITSLQEGLALLEKERFKGVVIDTNITERLLEKATSLQEGLDLLQHERFKEVPIDTIITNRLLQKATSLQEGLALLEKERFKDVKIEASIIDHLLVKTDSTAELQLLISTFSAQVEANKGFYDALASRISYYRDLKAFPIFWQNYQRFPHFAFLDKAFSSYAEVLQYLMNPPHKPTRLLWNHLLFVLLDKKLLRTQAQKDVFLALMHQQLQEAFPDTYAQIKDIYLFPDIQEMLDKCVLIS